MTHLIGRLQIRDFDTWQRVFADAESFRRARGALSETVYVDVEDRHRLHVVQRWRSLDAARAYVATAEFARTMKDAGVIGPLDFTFAVQPTSAD